MAEIVFLQGSVDFGSSLSLAEVADLIATRCFGGGQFVGEDEGIWDEVPAVRLDREPLGLEVVLGGQPGENGYTLEVASREPMGGALPTDLTGSEAAICQLSNYLRGLLERVAEIRVRRP